MKKSSFYYSIVLIFSILISVIFLTDCKKKEDPIKYPKGAFPDTVSNIVALNTAYDDYNLGLFKLSGNSPIVFSSNRKSYGGQFDLEQASISFEFDQTTGEFFFEALMTNDAFLDKLISKAQTSGNDFGPYRFFSAVDGYEYMVLSSVNTQGNLDMYFLKNLPVYNNVLPDVSDPTPVRLFNSGSDDAYFCLDSNQDTAYFTSNVNGNFDIFLKKRPAEMDFSTWFSQVYTSSSGVDSINTAADDKCPMILKNIMVFSSNRPGGLGGFDLYYSVFRHGKWSSAMNLGPGINTSSDEYRPVLGYHPDFINNFLMFSSNRPGGKGGFDLYFTGVKFPLK